MILMEAKLLGIKEAKFKDGSTAKKVTLWDLVTSEVTEYWSNEDELKRLELSEKDIGQTLDIVLTDAVLGKKPRIKSVEVV